MIRSPPSATLTDSLFPCTSRFRSEEGCDRRSHGTLNSSAPDPPLAPATPMTPAHTCACKTIHDIARAAERATGEHREAGRDLPEAQAHRQPPCGERKSVV